MPSQSTTSAEDYTGNVTWCALNAVFVGGQGRNVESQPRNCDSSGSYNMVSPLVQARKRYQERIVRYVDETDRTIRIHRPRRPSPVISPTPSSNYDAGEQSPSPIACQPTPVVTDESVPLPPETELHSSRETPRTPQIRCWPFQEPTEVLLFQHFTQNLSSFFDLCDPDHHFATQVPTRARLYPPLMDAILALSARHMSLIGKQVDTLLASNYYQRCLSILIPELDRVHQDRIDDLLAATIILRLHEELDGPFSGLETYRHSIGTRALLQNQASQVSNVSSLRRAAAWAGVRQEIYASIKRHKPPAIKASAEMLEHLRASSQDGAWADTAVSHCLDVLDFCFGESSMNEDLYDRLVLSVSQWEMDRPASYDPLCFYRRDETEAEGEGWDIRFLANWHAITWAYRSLARILLAIHNPRQPRVGLNRISAWKEVLREVHSTIKLLCSIAQCRPTIPGPSLIACMAVWLAGDMVEDPRERKRVLELLDSTEKVHGWPTQDIRTELVGLWES
ncbi:hypothetical protein BJY04DRAFT_214258 [Aspergillus karnatakaensis]|uniref:uncharacterized protein n=1 Tax=Aspergillus karnatakaensis TaxID=1810916 RepID=UPI003CCD34A3